MRNFLDILLDVHYNVHVNTKTTLSISEARKNIFNISNEAQKPGNYYTLTEKGRPKVVIISAEEFESWQETMEILADPAIIEDIKEANSDIQTGLYTKTYGNIKNLAKKLDAIPSTSKTKRSKTTR